MLCSTSSRCTAEGLTFVQRHIEFRHFIVFLHLPAVGTNVHSRNEVEAATQRNVPPPKYVLSHSNVIDIRTYKSGG